MKHKTSTGMEKPIRTIPEFGRRPYAFTIWLGALIRWTAHLGSKQFNSLYTTQSDNKNMFIGYLATIIALTIFMTMLIFYGLK